MSRRPAADPIRAAGEQQRPVGWFHAQRRGRRSCFHARYFLRQQDALKSFAFSPLMNKLVVSALLLLVRGSESLTLQRRGLFKAAVAAASVTAAGAQVSPARASEIDWQALGVPVERLNQPEPGRPPNPQASGPLANTPFGFQVGGGPRPEEEVRKIDEARYRAAGRSPLDGLPRAGPSFLEDGATVPPPERR